MAWPVVQLVATGGTIAMTGSPARPALSASELVEAVPELDSLAELSVEQLSNVPGVNLEPARMARAIAVAHEAVCAGAAGAVIAQGTDTIEEAAELADPVWSRDEPLAITGAIRPAGASGSDGPLNLLDAIRLAAAQEARGLGPVVVFDGLAHPAAEAVKSHSWRSDAFSSEAPLAEVREERLHPLRPAPHRRPPVAAPAEVVAARLDAVVPILAAAAGVDSRPLDALRDHGAAALVLIALGAGHLPETMLPGVDRAIAAGLPLVICARPDHGGTLERTYGFEGSEMDLAERGAMLAGTTSPWKARMRLLLALGIGQDPRPLFPSS
jgi:L-asparaginase